MNVETAVVPIAGLGTRLLPLTHLVAKEFLPVGNMPAIQLIVEELIASGIRRFIFVTSSQKPPVEPLFASAEFSQKYADRNLEFCSVIQTEQLGLGDAIRCATNLIDGPFLVALGTACLDRRTAVHLLERSSKILRTNKQKWCLVSRKYRPN